MALAPPHAEPALLMWQSQHAQQGVPHPAALVPSSIGRRRPGWRPPALAHLALGALAPSPPSQPCAVLGPGWFDGAEPCQSCTQCRNCPLLIRVQCCREAQPLGVHVASTMHTSDGWRVWPATSIASPLLRHTNLCYSLRAGTMVYPLYYRIVAVMSFYYAGADTTTAMVIFVHSPPPQLAACVLAVQAAECCAWLAAHRVQQAVPHMQAVQLEHCLPPLAAPTSGGACTPTQLWNPPPLHLLVHRLTRPSPLCHADPRQKREAQQACKGRDTRGIY